MRDGRRLIEDLRDVFQERIDGLERTGGAHLDRLAEKGIRELDEVRKGIDRNESDSRSRRGRRRSKASAFRRLPGKGHRRRRGRKSKRGKAVTDPAEVERRRILRRARSRANQRLAFLTHFGTFAATLGIILVTTRNPRVVAIVALSWGIGVFTHYLWAVAAPHLRDRWVEDEVGARSTQAVASERRQVETRSRRSMEDLSASIAHEIRNPITAAKSLVQQMGEDPARDDNVEYAHLALSELDRVERSISHLLRYARDEEPRFERLALREIAISAAEGLRATANAGNVELVVDFDREGSLRGDPEKLRRVVENLLSNAIDALTASTGQRAATGTSPRIEVLGGENLAGSEVWMRVIDNGPGIAVEERERIWSPFYTTRESGTGLGLALTRKTIEAHGGRIELIPRVAGGSEFLMSFPKDFEGSAGSNPGKRGES